MVRLLTRARARRADPELLAGLVVTCRYGGLLDESITAYQRVQQIDAATRTSVAYAYYMRGEYDRTIATDLASMPFAATLARFRVGDVEGGRSLLLALEHTTPHAGVRLISATYRLAIAGDVDALLPHTQMMADSGFADPEGYFLLAAFVAKAGASAAALTALERAVGGGFTSPTSMRTDPYFDPIRATTEFAQLLARAEAATLGAREAFDRAGGPALLGSGS